MIKNSNRISVVTLFLGFGCKEVLRKMKIKRKVRIKKRLFKFLGHLIRTKNLKNLTFSLESKAKVLEGVGETVSKLSNEIVLMDGRTGNQMDNKNDKHF